VGFALAAAQRDRLPGSGPRCGADRV